MEEALSGCLVEAYFAEVFLKTVVMGAVCGSQLGRGLGLLLWDLDALSRRVGRV